MPKMSLSDLSAILQAQQEDALAADQASELSKDRERAMKYYNGDVSDDLPTPVDRSKAVSFDVSDTVEGMMPALMEIFFSGDEVVVFNPTGPDDEDAAAQETDYVNHVFLEKNAGFIVGYSMIKDALLSKVGTVKVWWEEREIEQEETYTDLGDDEYALLVADPDIEITSHTEHAADDEDSEPSSDHETGDGEASAMNNGAQPY